MNFIRINLLFVFCLALISCANQPSKKSEEPAPYSAQGWGGTTCEQLIHDITPKNVGFNQAVENIKAYQAWVSGFVSGVNFATLDTYDVSGSTDPEESFKWLKQYCDDQPQITVPEAMHELLKIWKNEGKVITKIPN